MSVEDGNPTELLRAALQESTGDAKVDDLTRASILAGIGDDPELLKVFYEETAPAQTEFDVHVPGLEGDPHATRADWFGIFVSRMGVAVKEVSKSISDKKRLPVSLRVVGPAPGSVRVVLKAPIPPPDGTAELERTGDGQSIESHALRTVATLMDLAERNLETPERSPLTAAAQKLSGRARKSIRSVAASVTAASWEVEGELRQRGRQPEHIRLSPSGAATLLAEMDKVVESRHPATVIGFIDGQRRSLGAMWLTPEGKKRPIEAFVGDEDLLSQVIDLSTDPSMRVQAEFMVSVTFPEGDSTSPHESYELIGIRPAPDTQQPQLDA